MALIKWDEESKRFYETGVRHGVLYTPTDAADTEQPDRKVWNGVAWDGIISVTETPSGAEANALYADDIKYLNLISKEELGGTIEAYQSPKQFDECDGTKALLGGIMIGQQTRKEFALCYATRVGNDSEGADYDDKIHIIYGCKASPSDRQYSTMNDSPEAMTLSWEFTTTPVKFKISGIEYDTSIVTIEKKKLDAAKQDNFQNLLDFLYGTDGTGGKEPKLAFPEKVYEILNA